jgi:hypothetical protein
MARSDWFRDTDPRALQVFLQLQRAMPAAQKVATVFELTNMAMRAAEAGVRLQHPGASDREIFLRAAARRLDRRTMIAAYAWDPDEHP